MMGDLEARMRAEGEEGLRVNALISFGGIGRERREVITAEPCLPVAPVIRNVDMIGVSFGLKEKWSGA